MTSNITLPPAGLTQLVRRLEAATSRLEDMATSLDPSNPITPQAASPAPAAPSVPGAEQSKATPPPPPPPAAEPLPASIEDFDSLIKSDVQSFVDLSEKIGGPVAEQVWLFRLW